VKSTSLSAFLVGGEFKEDTGEGFDAKCLPVVSLKTMGKDFFFSH
jgi:hypothetical protein